MEADNILEKLNAATLKLLAPLSLTEAYAIIVSEAVKLVKGDDGLIVRHVNNEFKTVYGSSKQAATYKVRKRGNSYKALTEHRAILIHGDEVKETYPKSDLGIKSVIFIPLSYKETSEGVLLIRSHRDKQFTIKELNILKTFGSIASLAIKKDELYDQTKQALDVRDMFISIASHELRTPLTSLNGYVQLLHSRLSKTEGVESKWVDSLNDEAKRLTNLIKELLEINRIKQGTLQFVLRETHLSEVIIKAIERCQFMFPEREIEFKSKVKQSEDVIIADFEKMLQVITALLTNALKFSSDESKVTINLTKNSTDLLISVTDKGKGMGREDVRRVLQGFYKTTDNLKEGMGVGLMLAKHIIAYHNGDIDVKSELKKGTTIEIKLPKSSL